MDQSHLIDEDGVDRSLVRWMLSLTPTERLQWLDNNSRMLASARKLPDAPIARDGENAEPLQLNLPGSRR